MKFCSDKQKKNETIKTVDKTKINLKIKYFDGNNKTYYNIDNDLITQIEKQMIFQANERDKFEYINININKWGNLFIWLSSNLLAFKCLEKDKILLFFCTIVLIIKSISEYLCNKNKLNELKKYRILLENYKIIKENHDINKCLEFNNFYRDELDIFTIDKYRYSDMKLIKKELKKIK